VLQAVSGNAVEAALQAAEQFQQQQREQRKTLELEVEQAQYEARLALRRVATIESIGSSTRIEGSKLSDREVEKLLSSLEVKSFDTRDAQEVACYAETMELIFQSWTEITLTENHVKQLHRDLLKYSEKDVYHRGEYKTQSNSVAAFDETGKEIGIVFETATPFDTPRLMVEALDWVREGMETRQLHPLLVTAIFIVVFLEIHPFQDGNGRLSRILTTLLLLRAGYAYVQQLTGECDRTQQGRLLPRTPPDARNNQDRRAELATLGIVLPAGAPAADETAGQESRKRKDRSVGHAGTFPANRGVRTRTRTRYNRRHGYADRHEPEHAQAALPPTTGKGASGHARQRSWRLVCIGIGPEEPNGTE